MLASGRVATALLSSLVMASCATRLQRGKLDVALLSELASGRVAKALPSSLVLASSVTRSERDKLDVSVLLVLQS